MKSKPVLKLLPAIAGLSLVLFVAGCSSENEEKASEVKDEQTVESPTDYSKRAASESIFKFKRAEWQEKRNIADSLLRMKGTGIGGEEIKIVNARREEQEIASTIVKDDNRWGVKAKNIDLSTIPCRLRAIRPNGESVELNVQGAPEDCDVDKEG